jgi:hypothetical protein
MALVNFEKEVWPIFKERCIDCHQATREVDGKKKEPKAELRLDAAWAILKGGKNGKVITPEAADKSSLHDALIAPKDDDAHMPPKGDPLTADQIKTIKQWINEGAQFAGWEGNTVGRPPELGGEGAANRKREHDEFYKALEQGAKPIAEATLKKVKAAGVQVATISVTSPLVRVDFLTGVSRCNDDSVKALLDIADNIAHVDLGRCAITDASLATLAKMPRLSKLNLRQTKITDKGLESLTGLKKLQYLNLYGTEVTDAGIAMLATVKGLKQVFLWETKVTEAGAKKLQAALPGAQIVMK